MYSEDFLRELSLQDNRFIYVKIVSLSWNELPISTIEGYTTGGSINIDGNSAVRRTCSLTLITEDTNISNYYWGVNTKFKLEIGVKNEINSNYPDIIWFKQGTYIITSFSQSLNTSNSTINISGKDKMCLLNGEVGGSLEASVDFGKIEQVNADGNTTIISYPIRDIIREAVHQYAKEPFHNIIINDLDQSGLELQEYRGDEPLYLYREADTNDYIDIINGNTKVYEISTNKEVEIKELESYDSLIQLNVDDNIDGSGFKINSTSDKIFYCLKIEYGQTAGYTETELTYAGELIANIGESLTSILDKIVKMLGDYEYFYNLDGQFIFQKKKDYLNSDWSPIEEENGELVNPLAITSPITFTFDGSSLFTAFNNNVNLLNVKNDYSVWGKRKSNSIEIPIHMRYALDIRPKRYTTISVQDSELEEYNKKYNLSLKGQTSQSYESDTVDWREIIYQMALDYRKYNHLDNFELKISEANPNDYPIGMTGYEQYYIDLEGFWRQLYNPDVDNLKDNYNTLTEQLEEKNNELQIAEEELKNATTTNAVENAEKKIEECKTAIEDLKNQLAELPSDINNFYSSNEQHKYWNKNIYENSPSLSFWFDFLESDNELSKYSVKAIGARSKVSNDSEVKAISYLNTPNIIFCKEFPKDRKSGYRYFQITDDYSKLFSMSTQGKSAQDAVNTLLYNHSYCAENVSITAIPVYYLEPNTRIYINDVETGINGDYSVNRITLPLTYNGTMSLNAIKIINRIL